MKEPTEWVGEHTRVVADVAADLAARCHSLLREIDAYLPYSPYDAGDADDPMHAIANAHARRVVQDVRGRVLPELTNLSYMTDLQRRRANTCRVDAALPSSPYTAASDLRHRRLQNKRTQVIHTDDLGALVEVCGRGLADARRVMESRTSLPAAARSGTLGKTRPGKRISEVVQERLFEWSVQREARALADVEVAAAVGPQGSPSLTAAHSTQQPATVAQLRSLIRAQENEQAQLAARLAEEQQELINEQAFVDNLLSDVDTLENVLQTVHSKADAAEDALRASFYKMEMAMSSETDATVEELHGERDQLLCEIEVAKANASALKESLADTFRRHPAHEKIRHLQQHQLRPTLAMLKFAFDERRELMHTSKSSTATANSLANDVNDPLSRMWLRSQLPEYSGMPSVLLLHDLENGAFLQVSKAGPHGVRIDTEPNSRGERFTVRSREGDIAVEVKFVAS